MRFILAMAAIWVMALAPARAAAPSQDFIDRFESFDESRWFVSDGWSNADWMTSTWRRLNVDVTEEGAALTVARDPADKLKPYSAAEFRSKQAFGYGYFEAKLRVPKDKGLIAGFFAYTPATATLPQQEIDVEFLGLNTRQVELTMHVGKETNTAIIKLPFDASEGLHSYAFDWRKGAVRFFVDGKQVRKVSKGQFTLPDRELTFFLDLWATDRLVKWSGGSPAGTGPWTMLASCTAYAVARPKKPLCP